MTKFIRRGVLLALTLLLAVSSVISFAGAQEPTEGEECYPVPVGGCETETPTPTPTPTPTTPPAPDDLTCDEIIEAIAAGDVTADQNGDGQINEGDLPASCTCEELQTAVDAGNLPESALPDECTEDTTVVDDSQDNDTQADTDTDTDTTVESGTEDGELASTGLESAPLALLAIAGLLGGAVLVTVSRKRS